MTHDEAFLGAVREAPDDDASANAKLAHVAIKAITSPAASGAPADIERRPPISGFRDGGVRQAWERSRLAPGGEFRWLIISCDPRYQRALGRPSLRRRARRLFYEPTGIASLTPAEP